MDPDPDCAVRLRGRRGEAPLKAGSGRRGPNPGWLRQRRERRRAAEAVVAVERLGARDLSPAARQQVGAQRRYGPGSRTGRKHRLDEVSPRFVASLDAVRRVRVASRGRREIPVLRGKQRTVARARTGG